MADDHEAQLEEEALLEYAEHLGIDPVKHRKYMYIAKQALEAPLPDGWEQGEDEDGTPYYWSTITGSVTYDMPLELPPGWRITRDAKTRIVYFYNESTRETRQFRDPPPDSQEAYKLLVAGLPPPPPGAPVPFRRGSSSIIALSYAMRFVHKLKNMGKAGRESSGYI